VARTSTRRTQDALLEPTEAAMQAIFYRIVRVG
jgi:hypothetical protein